MLYAAARGNRRLHGDIPVRFLKNEKRKSLLVEFMCYKMRNFRIQFGVNPRIIIDIEAEIVYYMNIKNDC